MRKFLTPGIVAGALALGAGLANAAGYPVLGAFLSDPSTATTATNVLVGAAALVAGTLDGVKGTAS